MDFDEHRHYRWGFLIGVLVLVVILAASLFFLADYSAGGSGSRDFLDRYMPAWLISLVS